MTTKPIDYHAIEKARDAISDIASGLLLDAVAMSSAENPDIRVIRAVTANAQNLFNTTRTLTRLLDGAWERTVEALS